MNTIQPYPQFWQNRSEFLNGIFKWVKKNIKRNDGQTVVELKRLFVYGVLMLKEEKRVDSKEVKRIIKCSLTLLEWEKDGKYKFKDIFSYEVDNEIWELVKIDMVNDKLVLEKVVKKVAIETISLKGYVDASAIEGKVKIWSIWGKLKLGPNVRVFESTTKFSRTQIMEGGKVNAKAFKGAINKIGCVNGEIRLGPDVTEFFCERIGERGEVDARDLKGKMTIDRYVEGTVFLGEGVTTFCSGEIRENGLVNASIVKGSIKISGSVKGSLILGKNGEDCYLLGIDKGGCANARNVEGPVEMLKLRYPMEGTIILGENVTKFCMLQGIGEDGCVDASLIKGPVKIWGLIQGKLILGKHVTKLYVTTIPEESKLEKNGWDGEIEIIKFHIN